MSDFVAEIRPRTLVVPKFVPTQPGDFVAEIRPRSHIGSQPRHLDRHLDRHCPAMDCSDQDLETIISNRHFSREGITRLLEGSILTLVEKLLIGRPITRIEGCLCISLAGDESPITVNLNRTFPTVKHVTDQLYTEQSLESRLNVKVKHDDPSLARGHLPLTPEEELSEPSLSPSLPPSFKSDMSFTGETSLYDCKRDTFYNHMSDNEDKSYFSLECTRDGERCSPSPPSDLPFKPTSPVKDTGMTTLSSQAEHSGLKTHATTSPRNESDEEESGYTSNDKDDSDSSSEPSTISSQQKPSKTYNDYYCSGFDGKSTVYSSDERDAPMSSPKETNHYSPGSCIDGGDEMGDDDDDDDEDMDFDCPLVIDERPVQNITGSSGGQISRIDVHICKGSEQPKEINYERCSAIRIPYRRLEENVIVNHERMGDCMTDDIEDIDSTVSSDITDIDVAVDLSGDSSQALYHASAMPHPQSLVVKHPEGFKCKQCPEIMEDAMAVSRHAQSAHDLHCCTFCCRTFTAKNNLKRHIRIHTGQKPYQCTQCSQSFARRDDLKGHMLRHGYSKPFRCSLCKKGYTDRACVKIHMAKEHRSRLVHVCPQCGESYDQEEAFTAHKQTHPELQQFSCVTCSFIGNNNLMTLKHSLLHSHKLFSCKPCNAYFADPFDYTNHVRKHKKIPAFSQYVCCFCDVALSTYDQFVRHEYTHAQGKVHTCKTCRKQFKNKVLLQEHTMVHENSQTDKVHSEQTCTPGFFTNSVNTEKPITCTQSMVIEKPLPNFLHGKENTNNISKPATESRFTDDYSHFIYNTHELTPCPATTKEDNIPAETQLLDLRIKKASDPTPNDFQQNQDSFRSCSRATGFVDKNFRRNGVVLSESCHPDQEVEAKETHQTRELASKQRSCEDVFSPSNNQPTVNIDYNKRCSYNRQVPESLTDNMDKDQMSCIHTKTTSPTRPKSAEKIHVLPNAPYTRFEHRPLLRTLSQGYTGRPPLRFNPYSREKMADLAAKFIAARGTKLFEERAPLRAVLATCENRSRIPLCKEIADPKLEASLPTALRYQSELQDGRVFTQNPIFFSPLSASQNNNLACHTTQDTDDISREEPNPETALMCHAPNVVKSEVLHEQDLEFEASDDCQFQNSFVRNGTASPAADSFHGSAHYQIISHSCEDCKKQFRSFPELEHHSVELHKRYLCEHCGKSFTARPNRDRHVRYHTGERPYKCDLCDQAFFRGDDLKYHRTTRHPTAQPFTCMQCSASFTWGRDLDRHIRHSKCKS